MKKILVTGGAGFIGSNLCKRLIDEGEKVVCLDNLSSGKKTKLRSLLHEANFELVDHDICYPYHCDDIDQIYNLACPASPIFYQEHSIQTSKTSFLGSFHLLGLAKKTEAKILQASTSEVYGDPLVHPQPEQYYGNVNPIGPRSCYDEGKRLAESLFFDYHRQHNLQIKIARIFNTYGPGMDPNDGRVVSNFILQSIQGKPLTIYGDGQQTRSFCYVDDMVDALIRLMNSDDSITGPVNLGNPVEYSMLDLAKTIASSLNREVLFQFTKLPEDDPKQRQPDITYAKNVLKWEPQVNLQDGLKKTIRYFKNLS
tara:strand:+ start:774 stop:1709 length:936 start_codon:yes stop_codon:yes gene_type:complete